MDRAVCAIPHHQHHLELKRSLHAELLHKSFDLDGDGQVSPLEYRTAKMLDRQHCEGAWAARVRCVQVGCLTLCGGEKAGRPWREALSTTEG